MAIMFKSNENVFMADVDEIVNICQLVTDAARSYGMDEKCLWKLETAVDEACTNISCYGYPGQSKGKIWVEVFSDNGYFYVVIKDNGIPFDQSEPTCPEFEKKLCERKPGGLGRFIMKQFLDDMRYERRHNCNVLTLVKSLEETCE